MTPLERDIEQLKTKIEQSDNKIKAINWNGPIVVGVGSVVIIFLTFIMGFDVTILFMGLIVALSAVIWADRKSREMKVLREEMFVNKMRLYTLRKKL